MYRVEFNTETGRLQRITNLKSGINAMVDQQFFWYNSSTGNNINSTQVTTLFSKCIVHSIWSSYRVQVHISSDLIAQLYFP